ncbi:MAG TPA: sigma-54 dependent transcriptional regulator [Candidatus Acidoferrales bacterium]|nr:sigma-54 dependent transcriptional regulator [Candidatus Acidoferrales bacterium]
MKETRVDWIAVDPASERVLEIARKVADTATTILITGESGTGKDQLARWIHEAGPRRDAPLLKIDCASLPSELVESELFGHERGAFTGAEARKPGRMELAQEGTIVLDEVAALAPGIQAKLLRVLEERKFERLGGNETLEMDARLIALTNTNLELAVAGGRFREDLYFRLNVLVIPVPPLRERPGDIAPLADYWLTRLSVIHGRTGTKIEPAAMRALTGYAWPGNVRELKNAIEHALIFAKDSAKDGMLLREDFPAVVQSAGTAAGNGGKPRSLEDVEKEAIQATLEATHFKMAQAAKILGISRKTLLEKRKRYGLL